MRVPMERIRAYVPHTPPDFPTRALAPPPADSDQASPTHRPFPPTPSPQLPFSVPAGRVRCRPISAPVWSQDLSRQGRQRSTHSSGAMVGRKVVPWIYDLVLWTMSSTSPPVDMSLSTDPLQCSSISSFAKSRRGVPTKCRDGAPSYSLQHPMRIR